MKKYKTTIFAAIIVMASCSLRNGTTYYHASYIQPSEFEIEMGLQKPRGMKVEPTASYQNDSAAVKSERDKVTKMIQLVESREKAAQVTKYSTMRDSIRLTNESKAHRQILSERHTIIALDDAGTEDANALFHKIELFGFDSKEVDDFISKRQLTVRFYHLN